MSPLQICQQCPGKLRQAKCNGACVCTVTGRDVIDHGTKADCPKGYHVAGVATDAVATAQPAPAKRPGPWDDPRRGPEMWGKLHRWALTAPPVGNTWLMDFLAAIPCGKCKKHARAYVTENPPAWGPDLFTWTWRFHNAVNVRLGKAEMGEDEARREWGVAGGALK